MGSRVSAGVVAGAGMAVALMAWTALAGQGGWTNPNLIAVMWVGRVAALGGFSGATLLRLTTSALTGWIACPFIRDLPLRPPRHAPSAFRRPP